jgi:hypothetical protein
MLHKIQEMLDVKHVGVQGKLVNMQEEFLLQMQEMHLVQQ